MSGTIILLFLPVGSVPPGGMMFNGMDRVHEVLMPRSNYRHHFPSAALHLPNSGNGLMIVG
jgi:hypothetical protein